MDMTWLACFEMALRWPCARVAVLMMDGKIVIQPRKGLKADQGL